jgi:hypothetical protein
MKNKLSITIFKIIKAKSNQFNYNLLIKAQYPKGKSKLSIQTIQLTKLRNLIFLEKKLEKILKIIKDKYLIMNIKKNNKVTMMINLLIDHHYKY